MLYNQPGHGLFSLGLQKMKLFLTYLQITVAVILTFLIVIQSKEGGLTNLTNHSSYHSKKGLERIVVIATIGAAIIFVVTSAINAFLIS